MIRKSDITKTSDNYQLSFTKRGEIKTIRKENERVVLKNYAVVLRMGHSGNGYSTIKLISTVATDPEELKRRLSDVPRTKRDQAGFIISFAECSMREGKFIRKINDYDRFLTGKVQKGMGQRSISEELFENSLKNDNFHGETPLFQDVIQQTYSTFIVESEEDEDVSLTLKKNDKPLEGRLLYDYFKQKAIEALKAPYISQTDKILLMMNYAQIMPKYKKFVQADPSPFKVFFEELKPYDNRHVFCIQKATKDNETDSVSFKMMNRDYSKTQYVLCYYNKKNEKVSVLIPDSNVQYIFKHPSREFVEEYIKIKQQKIDLLNNYDFNELTDLTFKALSEDQLNVENLDQNLKITIKELVNHFNECEFNQDLSMIKTAKWELDFDGEFLGEDFYESKINTINNIDDETYQKFMKEKNARTLAKFKRFEQAKKESEPGDEE